MFKRESKDIFNNSSIIGASVAIDGDFCCDEDIVVFGKVNGLIKTSKSVIVKQSAIVDADIKANSVIIDGKVSGNIDSDEFVNISASAIILGNISTKIISIKDGAIFNGKCSIKKDKIISESSEKSLTLDKKNDCKKNSSKFKKTTKVS